MDLNQFFIERGKMAVVLGLSMLTGFLLLTFRIEYSGSRLYLFLMWNLFLAFVPYAISTVTLWLHRRGWAGWLLCVPLFFWLLFFPNSPYILTDLFHLRQVKHIPLWYDLVMILFFAWNGLMLGLLSLRDVHDIIGERQGKWIGWFASLVFVVLGSFGIYLGRFLRWNSWEIFTSPRPLLADIIEVAGNPLAHPQLVGVTLLFSVFLFIGYLMLRTLPHTPSRPNLSS